MGLVLEWTEVLSGRSRRWNRLHPSEAARRGHVEVLLAGNSPIVAATDYVRAYPQLIGSYTRARLVALGTDGFGRSDTGSALRGFFEVDHHHVAIAALDALAREGTIGNEVVAEALWREYRRRATVGSIVGRVHWLDAQVERQCNEARGHDNGPHSTRKPLI